jgi:cytochrome bd-type quinol oxidase subunit 2
LHTNARRFVKTGIVFLFVGLALGGWILVEREIMGLAPSRHLVSAHTHAIQLGFVMFLILGVALWLFPKAPAGSRYRPERIVWTYIVLTLATAVRLAAEVARAWSSAAPLRWAVLGAGLAQIAGFALYFWTMWPRIRSVGSHLREARGERF